MQRRALLASLGAASCTAGCSTVFSTSCGPGDRELGALYESVLEMSDPGSVAVRGTITRLDRLTLTIADGTGYAEIWSPEGQKFSGLETGDCVGIAGAVDPTESRTYGHLTLNLYSEDDLDRAGPTRDPPGGPPPKPDLTFDIAAAEDGMRLTHAGSDGVPAERLEFRHRPAEDLRIYEWSAVTGSEGTVEPGDSAVFTRPGQAQLVWRPDDHWGEAVSSGWEL